MRNLPHLVKFYTKNMGQEEMRPKQCSGVFEFGLVLMRQRHHFVNYSQPFFSPGAGDGPRTLCRLGKHSVTERHPDLHSLL
jgi:hypothetical protein